MGYLVAVAALLVIALTAAFVFVGVRAKRAQEQQGQSDTND